MNDEDNIFHTTLSYSNTILATYKKVKWEI